MAVWGNLGKLTVISIDEFSVHVQVEGKDHQFHRVDVFFDVIEIEDLAALKVGPRDGLKVESWFSRKVKEAK